MALNYNYANCGDVRAKYENDDIFGYRLEAICFAMMEIGIQKITAKNVDTAWFRYYALRGGTSYLRYADFQNFIGLETNVSPETDAAFAKWLLKFWEKKAEEASKTSVAD